MPRKGRITRARTFEELCEQGLADYLAHAPGTTRQGFMRFMLQNYYGLLLRFSNELSTAALMSFAAQRGLPDVQPSEPEAVNWWGYW